MASSKRVLLAGLFHETHTFVDGTTPLEEFETTRGEQLLATQGDASPMAGVVETGLGLGWEFVPTIDSRCVPSATVEDEVFDTWWRDFEPAALAAVEHGLDGVYLVLHGAMTSQTLPDVEGVLLERLRALPGFENVPIGGVTDLHANFSARMANNSNGLATYRENPHIDAKETAVRAAYLLDGIMAHGQMPLTLWQHPPVMWPPTGTATADEPMQSLEKMARSIEEENPDILAVNIHAGFSFADTPDTGVSFSIVTVGEPAEAQAQLQALSALALQNKAIGNVVDPTVEEILPKVQALLKEPGNGPIILVEPSDNIGGGAPGDGTGILKALIEYGIENAAVVIADAAAVEAVSKLNVGGSITLAIGGKGSRLSGGPATLEVELVSTSDGKFDLEDPNSHLASMFGLHIEMGPCAVVRHGSILILLTSQKTAPMDLGQLRSQGIIPEEMAVIGVKAAVAHRRAYDPIMRTTFNVATPGPCASDVTTLPFKLADRSVYPLSGT